MKILFFIKTHSFSLLYRLMFNFKKSVLIFFLADIINRADLGMEVMHERNAHNFPLDLASNEILPVAISAPSVVG